ncbi:14381_t:CDS:2, partial [Entrophospora sp. SA101]
NLTDFRYNSSRFLLLIHTSAENHLKGHTALFLCISPGLLGGIKAKHKYPILDKPTNDLTQQQPQKKKRPKKEPKKNLHGWFRNLAIDLVAPLNQMSKLYSVALDERIRIKCTTTALKHIDLKGGLDRYLLTMKDDKLGKKMYDLKLKIMDRLEEEKKRLAELDGRLLDNDDN